MGPGAELFPARMTFRSPWAVVPAGLAVWWQTIPEGSKFPVEAGRPRVRQLVAPVGSRLEGPTSTNGTPPARSAASRSVSHR